MRPFQQGRFDDIPELPRLPHAFARTEALELELDSTVFGPMSVHVRRYGAGPPLLLVHGLMTSSYSWRYVFERLGERFTCYAPDLPANGRTDPVPTARYSPSNLADWIIELQRTLGIYGCPVIGNSMGGFVSMVAALRDPDAMSRLINLHSPGVPELRLWALKAALSVPGTHALLRWMIRRHPHKWAHDHVHYYDESLKSLEEAREYGAPLASKAGAQGLVKYLTETMSIFEVRRFQATLRQRQSRGDGFPAPLLLLYARTDPMVPPRFGQALADRIDGSELGWLDEASHFAHVDAPDAFLARALEFLERR